MQQLANKNEMTLIPVILSGGAGTRLWPVSRELHPKPFIKLADGESLLQKTFSRAAALPGIKEILTVTNREFFFKTEDEYREINAHNITTSYILEPYGRNTAPAIAVAATYIAEYHDKDAIALVLPADHLILNKTAFEEAVLAATALAQQGRLVTFGIQPLTPETGYGYIEAEETRVIQFVEKPSLETAIKYVASGNYFWNSGMFCFSAETALTELAIHAPEVLASAKESFDKSVKSKGESTFQFELVSDSYNLAPNISIDYALMEKSNNVAVVTADIGWSDIGSWNAISDLAIPDDQGNRVIGKALLLDSGNCYIQSDERMVGVLGVDDLIIVDTTDALLVAHKSRAQDVKQIVTKLKQSGHESYKLHRTVHRPWGTYCVLEEGDRFKIKRIVVKPGASLSLQMHHHRSEHWIVVSGIAKVINGDADMLINTNESTFIPAGHKHRLENPGAIELVMIEVQSGEYLGEDDIVRFEDMYGRC